MLAVPGEETEAKAGGDAAARRMVAEAAVVTRAAMVARRRTGSKQFMGGCSFQIWPWARAEPDDPLRVGAAVHKASARIVPNGMYYEPDCLLVHSRRPGNSARRRRSGGARRIRGRAARAE